MSLAPPNINDRKQLKTELNKLSYQSMTLELDLQQLGSNDKIIFAMVDIGKPVLTMTSILYRGVFYPTLFYNVIMEKVSSRRWYDRIDDTVILGALPFRKMTTQLVNVEDVRGIITVNEDYELPRLFVNSAEEWAKAGVLQLHLRTRDFTAAPSQDKIRNGVKFIMQHRDAGNTVYVHCKAGRTRSATVVACYLIKVHEWTPEKAVAYIRERRPHIIIRRPHWQAIRAFYMDNHVEQMKSRAR